MTRLSTAQARALGLLVADAIPEALRGAYADLERRKGVNARCDALGVERPADFVARKFAAAKARRIDRETPEQERVVRALIASGVRFCAIPNGGGRTAREGAELQRLGVVPGVPDLVIWTPPPALPGKVGTVIEMKHAGKAPKTARAGRWSGATPEQRDWLDALEALGWHACIGYGAADALAKLAGAGYAVRW